MLLSYEYRVCDDIENRSEPAALVVVENPEVLEMAVAVAHQHGERKGVKQRSRGGVRLAADELQQRADILVAPSVLPVRQSSADTKIQKGSDVFEPKSLLASQVKAIDDQQSPIVGQRVSCDFEVGSTRDFETQKLIGCEPGVVSPLRLDEQIWNGNRASPRNEDLRLHTREAGAG